MQHNLQLTDQQGQILALAGLLQSSQQVTLLARQGLWSEPAARPCIHSLFQMNADSVIDVYGSIQSLKPGLRYLLGLLQKKVDRADIETTRYALGLLHLERKLKKHTTMLNRISQRLYTINNEFEISEINQADLLARIANTYLETISTIPPKIQVGGSRQYLTQETTINRVRAMLFSGIRSAVLWRQLGGSRWKLIFQRQNMMSNTRYLLEI